MFEYGFIERNDDPSIMPPPPPKDGGQKGGMRLEIILPLALAQLVSIVNAATILYPGNLVSLYANLQYMPPETKMALKENCDLFGAALTNRDFMKDTAIARGTTSAASHDATSHFTEYHPGNEYSTKSPVICNLLGDMNTYDPKNVEKPHGQVVTVNDEQELKGVLVAKSLESNGGNQLSEGNVFAIQFSEVSSTGNPDVYIGYVLIDADGKYNFGVTEVGKLFDMGNSIIKGDPGFNEEFRKQAPQRFGGLLPSVPNGVVAVDDDPFYGLFPREPGLPFMPPSKGVTPITKNPTEIRFNELPQPPDNRSEEMAQVKNPSLFQIAKKAAENKKYFPYDANVESIERYVEARGSYIEAAKKIYEKLEKWKKIYFKPGVTTEQLLKVTEKACQENSKEGVYDTTKKLLSEEGDYTPSWVEREDPNKELQVVYDPIRGYVYKKKGGRKSMHSRSHSPKRKYSVSRKKGKTRTSPKSYNISRVKHNRKTNKIKKGVYRMKSTNKRNLQ